jgi:hypothetical protein
MKGFIKRIIAFLLAILQATVIPPSVIQMVTTKLERKYKKEKDFEQQEQDRLQRKLDKHRRKNK